MGFPFLGARLFPAQSLSPARQERNRRCCSKWKVGGVKHGHFPSESHLLWRCHWAVFRRDPGGRHQGHCFLSKVSGVTDEPCVFPSPVAEEGTHPLFGLWVTFNPAGQGRPREAVLETHLSPCFSRQLVGAEQLNSPRWPRGRREDKGRIFFLVPGLCCTIPTAAPARGALKVGVPEGVWVPCCVLDVGLARAVALRDAARTGSRGALGSRCWHKPQGRSALPAWRSRLCSVPGWRGSAVM